MKLTQQDGQAKQCPHTSGREARKVTRGREGKAGLGRVAESQDLYTCPWALQR